MDEGVSRLGASGVSGAALGCSEFTALAAQGLIPERVSKSGFAGI